MTHITCPKCGERTDLFGGDGREAREGNLEVLAEIPIDPELAALCDSGRIEAYERNPFRDVIPRLNGLLSDVGGGDA